MAAKKKASKKAAAKKAKPIKQMPVEQYKPKAEPAKPNNNSRLKKRIIISAGIAAALLITSIIFLNIRGNTHAERSLPVKEYAKAAVGISCIDRCGDFTCDEIVCMADSCPCSENYRICPSDCREARFEDLAKFAKGSECLEKGELTENYAFNPETRTWWINLKMKPEFENPRCSPVCVIYEEEDKVEFNWRCAE